MDSCRLQRRITFAVLAAVCLTLATLMFPHKAFAEEALPIRMETGLVVPETNDNTSGTLMWAGKQWYVIGANGTGVAPAAQQDAYTLLAKDSFRDMVFRMGQATRAEGLEQYGDWYYGGTWNEAPAEYLGSTVQQYLQQWLRSDSGASTFEQDLAISRKLTDVGATGANAQSLWLLSGTEELEDLDQVFVALGRDSTAAAIDKSWWTRTKPADIINSSMKAVLVDPYGSKDSVDYIHNEQAVRPAATVKLSAVEYTSVAEARRGKTLARDVSQTPTAVTTLPASGKLPVYKYTIRTDDLELAIEQEADQPSTLSESLAFTYTNATVGDSQYVSCVLTTERNEVVYYGKLGAVDATSGAGEVRLSAASLADGTYVLSLYNEQSTGRLTELTVNGAKGDYEAYTDFVSAPTTFSLYVQDGKATTATEGTISYELNGGTLPQGKSNPDTHRRGAPAVDLVSPEHDDLVFDGWYRVADFSGEAVTAVDDALLGDVTLYAKWVAAPSADDIILNYASADTQGGTVSPERESVKPQTGAAKGAVATALPGYHFDKWTNDVDGSETTEATLSREWIDAIAKTNGTYVPVTFTAHFAVDRYQIAFEANGGTGEMSPQAMTHDVASALTKNAFVREGYDFLGWSTDATAATATYEDEATVKDLTDENGGTVTLCAVWKVRTHVVEFVVDDDDTSAVSVGALSDTSEVEHGRTVARPTDPVRAGYDFRYWATGEGSEFDFDTPVTGDLVLHAVWQARDYEVVYDAAGGLLLGAVSRTVNWRTADLLPATEPTYGSKLFGGWYLGDTKVEASATYAGLASDDTVSSITLTAHWSDAPKPTYSVTFDSTGGSVVAAQTVTEGASATRPADPTRTDSLFDDWYVTGTDDVFSFDTAIHGNTSLEARWIEAGRYRVTYVATGDIPAGWTPVIYGLMRKGDVFMVDDPAATGYEFDGWYVGAERSVKYSQNAFFTMPASDVTLTGTWRRASDRTVTFDSRGGSAVEPQQVESGSFAVRPSDPSRTGFIFRGWQLAGRDFNFDEPVISDVLLTATWEREATKMVTISFDLAGGKGTPPAAQMLAIGSKLAYPEGTFERDGYEFFNWVTPDGLAYDFDTAVKNDLTLHAGWTATHYRVDYDTGSSSIPSATVTWDTAALNAPLPTREGWVFKGWYCGGHQVVSADTYAFLTKRDPDGAWDSTEDPDPDMANITLVARWEAKADYSVAYDAAGGFAVPGCTGLTLAAAAHAADKSGFADVETTRDGYRFMGWVCNGGPVAADATYESLAQDGRANITLVAQWKQVARLTFEANILGEGAIDASLGEVLVTRTPKDSSTPSFSQRGPSITLKVDADTDDIITARACLSDAAIEQDYFGALWSGPDGNFVPNVEQVGGPRDWQFTVQKSEGAYASGTYKSNFFYVDPFAVVEYQAEGEHPAEWVLPVDLLPYYEAGETFTLPLVPSIEGWMFKGWKMTVKSVSLLGVESIGGAGLYAPGDTYTVSEEDAQNWNTLSFAGVWQKAAEATVDITYAVSGDVPDGWTAPQGTAAQSGSTMTLPAVDVPQGYTFDGWYLGDVRYEPSSDVVLPSAGDVTFTGTWRKAVPPVGPGGPGIPDMGDTVGMLVLASVLLLVAVFAITRVASKRKNGE